MADSKRLPGGLWPVMLTPFRENLEVDFEGLRRLTRFYLDAGAAGLFANCLSSEMFQLTETERLRVIETVVDQSGGQVPVVATGTFSSDAGTAASFIRRVADAGAAAVILITSVIASPQDDEEAMRAQLETIIHATGNIPLGLYECPVPYKRLATPAMLQWVARTGRFFYHKDTSCDAAAIDRKVKAMEHTPFVLYNADTPTAVDSLVSGAGGVSPIAANFYPELYASLLDRFSRTGRTDEVDELHASLTVMDSLAHLFYPMSAKIFLEKRGMRIAGHTRLPVQAMKNDDRIKFEALYRLFVSRMEMHGLRGAL